MRFLDSYFLARNAWIPIVTFIPGLLSLGWFSSHIIRLLTLNLFEGSYSLLGSLISFFLYISLLPRWVALRWNKNQAWFELGVMKSSLKANFASLIKGIVLALFCLSVLISLLSIGSWLEWKFDLDIQKVIDSMFLLVIVGFVEELIFRGWLYGELRQYMSPFKSSIFQALVYGIVHMKLNVGFWQNFVLLIGLFLLGFVLALRRRIDKGSLWTCIGLHGGLVSGWLLLNSSFIDLSPSVPVWLVGPGMPAPNPIGGLVSMGTLIFFGWNYLKAEEITRFPSSGAFNDSSRDEIP